MQGKIKGAGAQVQISDSVETKTGWPYFLAQTREISPGWAGAPNFGPSMVGYRAPITLPPKPLPSGVQPGAANPAIPSLETSAAPEIASFDRLRVK